MPVIGNIALADATPVTPVVHTFEPAAQVGSKAKLANGAASILLGRETLEIEVITPSPGNTAAAHRVKIKAIFPTVAAVDGQDTVVRTSSFEGVLNISQLSTLQERKNMAKLLSNLFLDAKMIGVIEKAEPLY